MFGQCVPLLNICIILFAMSASSWPTTSDSATLTLSDTTDDTVTQSDVTATSSDVMSSNHTAIDDKAHSVPTSTIPTAPPRISIPTTTTHSKTTASSTTPSISTTPTSTTSTRTTPTFPIIFKSSIISKLNQLSLYIFRGLKLLSTKQQELIIDQKSLNITISGLKAQINTWLNELKMDIQYEKQALQSQFQMDLKDLKLRNNDLESSLQFKMDRIEKENQKLKSQLQSIVDNMNKTQEPKLGLHEIQKYIRDLKFCSKGWKEYAGRCYWFRTCPYPCSANRVKRQCNSLGAQLTTVRSQAHQDFLQASVPVGKDIWVGGHDGEMGWTWEDGQMVRDGYTNWQSGLPVKGHGQNCMYIDGTLKVWVDLPCGASYRNSFICEMEKQLSLSTGD